MSHYIQYNSSIVLYPKSSEPGTAEYAMAVYNQHVCPLSNWVYNLSCEEPLVMQSGQFPCCTLDNIPLISKCGVLPPESCWFSLLCNIGSFMVILIGLLRYAQVVEQQKQDSVMNMMGLYSGWFCAAGLNMVGNFQVDFAKVLHYMGVILAFPTSLLFMCVQTILTYRLAKTHTHCRTAHLRLALSLLTLITFLLGAIFFPQDSFTLQHSAAVCEWLFANTVLLFYGTFAIEFRLVSAHTLLVLIQKHQKQGFSQNELKLCLLPVRMESEYLKQRLGKCLVEALAEVVEQRPMDPVAFLAHYIYKYKENMEYAEKVKKMKPPSIVCFHTIDGLPKAAYEKQVEEEVEKAREEAEHQKRLKEEEERLRAAEEVKDWWWWWRWWCVLFTLYKTVLSAELL
ncbi:transmembrane protein 150A-like [Neoarius graeffei]|uniref:transmembrane protein 150A-like n=1 Tax=Neoarius graeffei TaxID=443677 RepID=UPI00298C5A8E|nr:transmembrane protein 150A-like [Neoarius graeffei]